MNWNKDPDHESSKEKSYQIVTPLWLRMIPAMAIVAGVLAGELISLGVRTAFGHKSWHEHGRGWIWVVTHIIPVVVFLVNMALCKVWKIAPHAVAVYDSNKGHFQYVFTGKHGGPRSLVCAVFTNSIAGGISLPMLWDGKATWLPITICVVSAVAVLCLCGLLFTCNARRLNPHETIQQFHA